MSEFVLDASALLALFNGEEGAELVSRALPTASISSVNVAEVAAKLQEHAMPDERIRAALLALKLPIAPFTIEQALTAGLLRKATRSAGLSLGDRSCLALTLEHGATALTADQAWARISLENADIKLIRTKPDTR